MRDDFRILRKETEVAMRAVQLSICELAQVTRCLAIATAYSAKSDYPNALAQLNEIAGRLERAEEFAAKAVSTFSSEDDAS